MLLLLLSNNQSEPFNFSLPTQELKAHLLPGDRNTKRMAVNFKKVVKAPFRRDWRPVQPRQPSLHVVNIHPKSATFLFQSYAAQHRIPAPFPIVI